MNVNDLQQMIDKENISVDTARAVIKLAFIKGGDSVLEQCERVYQDKVMWLDSAWHKWGEAKEEDFSIKLEGANSRLARTLTLLLKVLQKDGVVRLDADPKDEEIIMAGEEYLSKENSNGT